MLVNFKRRDIIVLSEWKNILTTHDYEEGELESSQSGGYSLDFKINKASFNTQVENISLHYISYKYSSSHHYKSLIFWEKFKVKSQSGKMVWLWLIDF